MDNFSGNEHNRHTRVSIYSTSPSLVLDSHFGAEVIKIEPPSVGDPLRVWRELDVDGVSPWFRSLGRNKKSVAIDLRQDEGRAYVLPGDLAIHTCPLYPLT